MSGPFSIGSDIWAGTSKLVEETGELGQVLGKLIATGGNLEHWDGSNLGDRLCDELGDVLAAIGFFIAVNELDDARIEHRRLVKQGQFAIWQVEQEAAR